MLYDDRRRPPPPTRATIKAPESTEYLTYSLILIFLLPFRCFSPVSFIMEKRQTLRARVCAGVRVCVLAGVWACAGVCDAAARVTRKWPTRLCATEGIAFYRTNYHRPYLFIFVFAIKNLTKFTSHPFSRWSAVSSFACANEWPTRIYRRAIIFPMI